MRGRSRTFLFLVVCAITLIVCSILFYFSPFNYFAPLKPNCLPIRYPEGTLVNAEDGKITTYEVEASIDDLVAFFEQKMRDPKNINRFWLWEKTDNNDILFVCASAANAYEAERGCIYLKETGKTTSITSVWSHSPDSAPLCSYFIEDLINK